MPGVSRSYPLRAPLLVAVAMLTFAALAVSAAIATGPLEHLDLAVARGLNQLIGGHPLAVSFWRALTRVGSPFVWDTVAGVVVVVLLLRGRRRLAVVGIVALAGAGLLSTLLKNVIDRPRPRLPVTLDHAAGMSFPSGHAMTSLVAVAFLVCVARSVAPRLVSPRLFAVAGVVTVAIGFSRLILGVHYLTDVLGGWLAGALWLYIVLAVANRTGRPNIALSSHASTDPRLPTVPA